MDSILDDIVPQGKTRKQWWSRRRIKYNLGLVVAGILAFVLYAVIVENCVMPIDPFAEITVFTTLFQGVGYLFMMVIANLCYNLGYFIDQHYNSNDTFRFRQRLFALGFCFSVCLPFTIPLIVWMTYCL